MNQNTNLKITEKNIGNKPKSQITKAIIVIALVILLIIYIGDFKLSLYLLFGIGFGIILQRSRFCFTAAFRDPIITRTTSLTNALLLSITMGSIGVVILNFLFSLKGKRLIGIDAVYPLSILTLVGGILFGIGMVIASGCASGTLVRIGEGMKLQWLSFIFFLLGAILGSGMMGYIDPLFAKGKITLFLPDYVGWLGALGIQCLLILLVYILMKKFAKRKRRRK